MQARPNTAIEEFYSLPLLHGGAYTPIVMRHLRHLTLSCSIILMIAGSACSPKTNLPEIVPTTARAVKHSLDTLENGDVMYFRTHAFSITLPSGWYLSPKYIHDQNIDSLSSLTLYTYRLDTVAISGHFFPHGDMKIDIAFIRLRQDPETVIRRESVTVDGIECETILSRGEFGRLISTSFEKKGRAVSFIGYSNDTTRYQEFTRIVESFKFVQ